MKKIICTILLIALTLLLMTSCGKENQTGITDLSGTWKQTNSKSSDSYQEAIISNETIEIYWVSNNGETKSLYWAGSYTAPSKAVTEYSWSSVNDHEKTRMALLASNDDTKTISYKDGELSWEASAMGVTTTVKLEKVK